ncbi:uncharacterized protein B0I36DRAFT_267727, partial [Microdochium trichocladiopsis]
MASANAGHKLEELQSEIASKFCGIARIAANCIYFSQTDGDIDAEKLDHLVGIFRHEGCDRANPSHFLAATIPSTMLESALALSRLSLSDLNNVSPPLLHLPPGEQVGGLYGRHRIAAVLQDDRLASWWPVKLYAGYSLAASMMTSKWWTRLDKSKPEILKRIFKHPALAPVLEKVVRIPGMRPNLQLGTWNKIFHCIEEVVHYLLLIYNTWVYIMGSPSALEFVDSRAVQSLELLVPGVSKRDQLRAEAAIRDHHNFRCIDDETERTNILHRLTSVQHLIPSIRTLQNDFKYLRECTHVVKRLICGKTPSSFTVQTIAWKAFKPPARHPASEEVAFENHLRFLYIAVMNDLCDLSGQTPLKDEGPEHQKNFQPDPRTWFRLACRAKQLGFVSEEISRLSQADPDREIALKALLEARPLPDYDYGTGLESFVQLIRELFDKAHKVDFMETPRPLTTSQNGEPTYRRCGRLYGKAYARDRDCITVDTITCNVQLNTDVTSLFVRRSVFRAFWG